MFVNANHVLQVIWAGWLWDLPGKSAIVVMPWPDLFKASIASRVNLKCNCMNEPADSYALVIATDEATALILGEALADWNLGIHLPDGDGAAKLEIFCATRAEAESCRNALRVLVPQLNFDSAIINPVARQDWAENWKQFFHLQRVSERIVIKPSWESFDARPTDCIVEIDPGLSFGTGLHGTTRACLQFLDQWQGHQPQASVLDMVVAQGFWRLPPPSLGFPV